MGGWGNVDGRLLQSGVDGRTGREVLLVGLYVLYGRLKESHGFVVSELSADLVGVDDLCALLHHYRHDFSEFVDGAEDGAAGVWLVCTTVARRYESFAEVLSDSRGDDLFLDIEEVGQHLDEFLA